MIIGRSNYGKFGMLKNRNDLRPSYRLVRLEFGNNLVITGQYLGNSMASLGNNLTIT